MNEMGGMKRGDGMDVLDLFVGYIGWMDGVKGRDWKDG